MNAENESGPSGRVPLSCAQHFDRVYYCYSPIHQGRFYYRNGELDNCRGKMRSFRMCVMSRLRSQAVSEQVYAAEEAAASSKRAPPVWEIRPEYLERIPKSDAENEGTEDTAKWWKE